MERSAGREISECTGRNESEHRASLEKGNADADLVEIQERLVGRREQAERPESDCRGSGDGKCAEGT